MEKLKHWGVLLLIGLMVACMCACSDDDDDEIVSSRAYSGHETDVDANNFVNVYPATVGTRLDDCQTCHRAGVEGTDTETVYNACDYCHLLEFPDSRKETGVPEGFGDTLNAYGLAYSNAGKSRDAIRAIANEDSDSDGYSNAEEIESLRYPGSAESKPDQELAPTTELSLADLEAMPQHSQFLLMNTTKQQFDDYVTYKGIKITDLLDKAGVDLTGAEGITVFAPDGFGKDYSTEDINTQYPNGTFYQTPEFDDSDKELVNYPAELPEGIADGQEIQNPLWLMLALYRDGTLLDAASYDGESGRLEGEGPYRLVMPQWVPSRPDRGSKFGVYSDGWDFDETIDHNAGNCVRGACVIRVNPMPEGYEEFDWKNGWSLIDDKKVIIYGHGVNGE